ncbi:MAG: hypothetical protein HY223_02710 [Thaumarchaeota archaeon]|nr:hypothetical protein [Nitrososphaerota archaeon]MBI3639203.1 hypothetical protein [Nitrososphaerota archaeon]
MTLTNREMIIISISNAIALYSEKLRDDSIPQNHSVIDFILKTIPESSKSELSMELIDDVFSFISRSHMELS